ncbi:MAG: hypothetical protein VYA54_03605 [Bdellovibrionota bacterium]|nr:hypothetical protein [Bdellovibrionota bacterium]
MKILISLALNLLIFTACTGGGGSGGGGKNSASDSAIKGTKSVKADFRVVGDGNLMSKLKLKLRPEVGQSLIVSEEVSSTNHTESDYTYYIERVVKPLGNAFKTFYCAYSSVTYRLTVLKVEKATFLENSMSVMILKELLDYELIDLTDAIDVDYKEKQFNKNSECSDLNYPEVDYKIFTIKDDQALAFNYENRNLTHIDTQEQIDYWPAEKKELLEGESSYEKTIIEKLDISEIAIETISDDNGRSYDTVVRSRKTGDTYLGESEKPQKIRYDSKLKVESRYVFNSIYPWLEKYYVLEETTGKSRTNTKTKTSYRLREVTRSEVINSTKYLMDRFGLTIDQLK